MLLLMRIWIIESVHGAEGGVHTPSLNPEDAADFINTGNIIRTLRMKA